MYLPRVDPDNGPVLLVQLDDLEGVLAVQDDFVVKFVPLCQRGKSGTGDVGEGTEVEAVISDVDGIEGEQGEEKHDEEGLSQEGEGDGGEAWEKGCC